MLPRRRAIPKSASIGLSPSSKLAIAATPWRTEARLVADLTDAVLDEIMTGFDDSEVAIVDAGEEDFNAVDLQNSAAEAPVVEEALETASGAFETLTAPRGAPDDLTKLSGMGPDAVQKLNDGGIYHFWQIAAMTPADVTKIDHDLKLGGKIDREGWVAQARDLADA